MAAPTHCVGAAEACRGLLAEQVEAVRQQVVENLRADLLRGLHPHEVVSCDSELVCDEQVGVQHGQGERHLSGAVDEDLRQVASQVRPCAPGISGGSPTGRRPQAQPLHERADLLRQQRLRFREVHLAILPDTEQMTRLRFSGSIAGIGTTSGRRVVVGHWPVSPFGAFTDCMVEDLAGHRTLLAPTQQVAELVSGTYVFDEVRVVEMHASVTEQRWSIAAGPLEVRLTPGPRTPLGWLLRAVPGPVAGAPLFAAAVDPLARRVLRGVRTRVTAREGDREWYGARDQRAIVAATVRWDGQSCGDLQDVVPPVRFGPGSTPPRPSVVDLVSTVERGSATRQAIR
ncbi:MAG: hypothetical protein JWO12_1634 [Frankiales bacterium]|nr:hypothetical protein [Frankiales bacterium]